jgi:hypothetical protein
MMAETIQKAATNFLLTTPEVVASVGKFTVSQKPFIFRNEIIVNLEDHEYSAVSAIVVEDGGPLAANSLTRFRARRLRVTIWANGIRDAAGILTSPASVEEKINDTFLVLDKYLHRTDPAPVMWSTIRTISSDRIGDLSEPVSVIDGDGIQIATVNYAVFF